MKQIAGDGFVLIGDAGRFVDPIFSTGVSIALNSSRFASRDVIRALETGDFGREAFGEFETTIRRGTKNWYEFITVYYRLNILFTALSTTRRTAWTCSSCSRVTYTTRTSQRCSTGCVERSARWNRTRATSGTICSAT